MSAVQDIAALVARQALNTAAAAATSSAAAAESSKPVCDTDNDYDGRLGVRVSAIFVILVGSLFGAAFPVYAKRHRRVDVPNWTFFVAKYFGSGVIIATAFIHLLAPACDALTDPCLTGPITEYDWAEGIALMTIFVLFFIELMAMRYATFGQPGAQVDNHAHGHSDVELNRPPNTPRSRRPSHIPGEDHLSHVRDHIDHDDDDHHLHDSDSPPTKNSAPTKIVNDVTEPAKPTGRGISDLEDFRAQLTAIFILEFGVIFHSIFVGLTLAVAGSEFNTLYVVLVFHQTFEGLGLGSRLAVTPWPKAYRTYTPYLFALGYGLSTPIAIAIGLGVRTTYAPGSQKGLIVNGVFDSISAGILIYTGLVELMAHEFMFSSDMRNAKTKVVLSAFAFMCTGAGLMALLGKWA